MEKELSQGRKYELDALRVALVLLVFFHHSAMPFNGDEWHIMNAQSSKLLDDIMVYFEQWRLPLLLFISGAGTILAFSKRNVWQFVKERSKRLLIPLIFGALFIIPPQTYYQFISRYTTYLGVYPEAFIKPETNHLWFIKFLFVFSIVSIPLILFIRSDKSTPLKNLIGRIFNNKAGAFLLVLPLIVLVLVTKKYYPDDDTDLTNLSSSLYYYFFFIVGMLCAATPATWVAIRKYRRFNLIMFIISFALFYTYYFLPHEQLIKYFTTPNLWNIWWIVCSLVGWTTMLTILGYAQEYVNKPRKWLPKLNEAVYPFYILHQTVIVVVAYYIVQWQAGITVKLMSVTIVSFLVVVLFYRLLIYPFQVTRVLFGMKSKRLWPKNS